MASDQPEDVKASAVSSAVLESKLEEEKAERKQERFLWIFVVSILTDVIVFKFEDSVWSNVFFSLLTLILLMLTARWLEVPWVHVYFDRMFNRLLRDRDQQSVEQEER